MTDRETQLLAATMAYFAQCEREGLVHLGRFVAQYPEPLRAELRELIEVQLAVGVDLPATDLALTASEAAAVQRAESKARAAFMRQLATPPSKNLVELRNAKQLSVGKVARAINLPPDLLARIERGKVTVSSLPNKLISELARVLEQSEASIRAALEGPLAKAQVSFSAQDDLVVSAEPVLDFSAALAASSASPAQRAAWQESV